MLSSSTTCQCDCPYWGCVWASSSPPDCSCRLLLRSSLSLSRIGGWWTEDGRGVYHTRPLCSSGPASWEAAGENWRYRWFCPCPHRWMSRWTPNSWARWPSEACLTPSVSMTPNPMQSRVARLRRRRLHLRRHCGFGCGCGGSNGADKGEGTSSIVEEGADGDMDDRGESTGEGDCHVPCDRRRAYSDNRLRSRALASLAVASLLPPSPTLTPSAYLASTVTFAAMVPGGLGSSSDSD